MSSSKRSNGGNITKSAKINKQIVKFSADDVWAAACTAYRINSGYHKVPDIQIVRKANRDLIVDILNDITQITDEDRKLGQSIRTYYQGYTFKILQSKYLTDFETKAMKIASLDTISNKHFSIISSLPYSYLLKVERDRQNEKLNSASGGFINAKIGERIDIEVNVVKCVFSNLYSTYFISGLTDLDQAVFFSYRIGLQLGTKIKVKGTVKNFKSGRNEFTQLNRVTIVENVSIGK